MMKFSCQDKLLPGNDYTEKYMNAVKAGFDSIEVNVSEKLPLSEIFKDILAASSASTIKPSTVCGGYRGWIGDFKKDMRNMAIEDIKNMFSPYGENWSNWHRCPCSVWNVFKEATSVYSTAYGYRRQKGPIRESGNIGRFRNKVRRPDIFGAS